MEPIQEWYRLIQNSIYRIGSNGIDGSSKLRQLRILLRLYKPVVKASLVGLLLDALPWLLVARLKLSHSPSWNILLVKLRDDIMKGGMIKKIFARYPKGNSWISSFFVTSLLLQILSPKKITTHPGEKNEPDINSDTDKVQNEEVKQVIKNFLAALASVSIGLLVLRHKSPGINNKNSHLSLALYSCTQAAHAMWVVRKLRTLELNQKWEIKFPQFDLDLNEFGKYAEVGVFGFSCYNIMRAWFLNPEYLPRSYNKWISRFAHCDPAFLDYLKQTWNGTVKNGQHSDILKEYCLVNGLDAKKGDPYYGLPPCHIIHHKDGENCPQQFGRRFLMNFKQSFLTTYLPLNIITFVIKPKNIIPLLSINPQGYKRIITKILLPTVQSSAFLSTFVTTIFLSICTTRRLFGTDQYAAFMGSALCGFTSILVEAPSRRLNLAMYVLPRALDVLYRKYLIMKIPPHMLEFPLFAWSLATLLTCFNLYSKSVQAPTQTVFKWIWKDNESQ